MEVGVAWAACGLADTGTCVVESTNEDIRLATMLPETSVLLIRRSTILPGNENGAEVLQKFFPNFWLSSAGRAVPPTSSVC